MTHPLLKEQTPEQIQELLNAPLNGLRLFLYREHHIILDHTGRWGAWPCYALDEHPEYSAPNLVEVLETVDAGYTHHNQEHITTP